jgi:uncharacterized protein (TIGR02722 family)
MKRKAWNRILAAGCLMLCGCGTTRVQRMDLEEPREISGYWNDTDSRLTAEAIVQQALEHAWYTSFSATHQRKPVVIVGDIRNRSSEHIPSDTFVKDLERALVNSGQVTLVADKTQRTELREERRAQQEYSREETAKRLAAETGADFMLKGAISTLNDKEGRREVKYYQVDVEMIDLETNEKVWMGFHKVRKYVKRARLRL